MKTGHTARPKLFIGIDIHKRSWKIHCSTDISGGKTFSMSPSPEGLKNYVERYYPDHEVSTAYEASCCGYRAHRCFEEYGWRSLVVNPADIFRRGKERHTKTDHIDAQLIARELKDGRLECIRVPDKCREQLRSLFRRRNDLVKDMRQIKSYIKMQLLYYGIHVPYIDREELRSLFRRRNDLVKDFRRIKSYIKMQLLYFGIKEPEEFDNDHWSHKYRNWLDDMVFKNPTAKATLDSRMRFFRFVDQELRDVSTQLRRYCKTHHKKDYMLLRSIPGIGGIVACGILCELGDLRRFNSIKHLADYVGLAPGVHQSGSNYRTLGITPRAHRLIWSYFV
jgi:transposase